MKLAFTTLGCPHWSLEQCVEAAQRYGYDGLELRLLDGRIITAELGREDRRRVKAVCASAALPIVCLDTSVSVAQPDPAAREAQIREGRALLELASEWEAPLLRVFAAPPPGTSEAVAVEAAVATLAALAGRGRELGVAIALETHDAFARGAVLADVLARVPEPEVGALWDFLHPFRMGEPVSETASALKGRTLHAHVKDGRPPDPGAGDWKLTLLGEGVVPTPAILAALNAAGYTGWLAVEWEKMWHPELAEPELALPQHAETLRAYLALLPAPPAAVEWAGVERAGGVER